MKLDHSNNYRHGFLSGFKSGSEVKDMNILLSLSDLITFMGVNNILPDTVISFVVNSLEESGVEVKKPWEQTMEGDYHE